MYLKQAGSQLYALEGNEIQSKAILEVTKKIRFETCYILTL
jgi:hypothetical protein